MVVIVPVLFWILIVYLFKSQVVADRLKNKFHKEFGLGNEIKIVIEIENTFILYDNKDEKCKCMMSVNLFLPTLDGKTLHPGIINNSLILGEKTTPLWGDSFKGFRKKSKEDFFSERYEDPNVFCLLTKGKFTDFILEFKKKCYCDPVFELKLTELNLDGTEYPIGFFTLLNSESEDYQRWFYDERMFPIWLVKRKLY